MRTRSGEWKWILSRGKVVERDEHGRALRMTGTNADISERKRAEERLEYLAQYDTLTGLPNRALFRDRLALAMTRAKRNEQLLGVMFLDLDRFKGINDTLGHAMGDRVRRKWRNGSRPACATLTRWRARAGMNSRSCWRKSPT